MFGHKNRCCRSNRFIKLVIIVIIAVLIIFTLYRNSGLFYRKGIILPFSLHLNRQELYMTPGEEFRLFVYGINKRVSFYSTNFRVAGVDFTGRVYAHRTGRAVIVAKVGNKKLKCRVKVIELNKRKLYLKTGDTFRLRVKGPVWNAAYKSSNLKVATVSSFGRIKAKRPGKTTITVKVKGKSLKCQVIVR